MTSIAELSPNEAVLESWPKQLQMKSKGSICNTGGPQTWMSFLRHRALLQALGNYTLIVKQFPDLAISNYARIGRALMLYQTGNPSEAILELQDLESSLRGYAEVHAAIASIIYTERPSEISYAEQQFDLASEFDSRYLDVEWVRREKHWPPAMLKALQKFATLN